MGTFGHPIANTPQIDLIYQYPKEGISETKETSDAKSHREKTEAHGSRGGMGILDPVLVFAFSCVAWSILVSHFPKSPQNLPIPYSEYISDANETTAAKRSRKQTEARGSRRNLGILDPALVSALPGVLKHFGVPFSKIVPPNLPIPYSGYISETDKTTAAERSRKHTDARGSRREIAILASALVSAFSGVFHTFRFPIFQNPPPSPPKFTTTL